MYVIMGRPSKELFEPIIKKGIILNKPVTLIDFKNVKVFTERIWERSKERRCMGRFSMLQLRGNL
jgi:hypothetical protein